MNWNCFKEKIDKHKYEDLEIELIGKIEKENDKKKINILKYQLGICYTYIVDKELNAIEIFKELISNEFNTPFIYSYLSKHTLQLDKKEEYIDSGLLLFKEDEELNRQKMYYTTDENKAIESYITMEKNNCTIYADHIKLASIFFNKKEYDKALEYLNKFDLKEIEEEPTKNEVELIKCICSVLKKESIDIKSIKKYTMSILNEQYGNLARYIEIKHFLNREEYTNIEKSIGLLNYEDNIDGFFEVFLFESYGPIYFLYEEFISTVKEILKKSSISEQCKNKIECINIIYEHNNIDDDYKYTKKKLNENIKIIEKELNNCRYDRYLCETLFDFLLLSNKEKEAIDLLFDSCIDNYSEKNLWYISKYNMNEETIKYITERLYQISGYKMKSKKLHELIKIDINLLFKNKKYEDICKLEKIYSSALKFDSDTSFNIAYSYSEIENFEISAKYYEIVLDDDENNSAALNNLGVIYKNKGDIEKALELFNKSEEISHDDIHMRNIEDCHTIQTEKIKQEEQLYIGEENVKKENGYVIDKLYNFSKKANENGDVICSYYELQQILSTNADKANEILKTFLDKKYIFKLSNHNYNTHKSVYSINENVIEYIALLCIL